MTGQRFPHTGHDGASDYETVASISVHVEPDDAGIGHGWLIVAVGGEVDNDTAPALLTALTTALDEWAYVRCDLHGVSFFGAAGVNTVLAAHLYAVRTERCFTLCGVSSVARRVLTITGVDGVLPLVA